MEFYVAAEPDVIPDVAAPTVKKGDLISLVRQMRDRRINTYRWMIGRNRRDVLMLISYCQDLYDYLVDNASYSPSTNDVTINTSNLLPPSGATSKRRVKYAASPSRKKHSALAAVSI